MVEGKFLLLFYLNRIIKKLNLRSNKLTKENLVLVDKAYVLSDYEKMESDIVYNAKIGEAEVSFSFLVYFLLFLLLPVVGYLVITLIFIFDHIESFNSLLSKEYIAWNEIKNFTDVGRLIDKYISYNLLILSNQLHTS